MCISTYITIYINIFVQRYKYMDIISRNKKCGFHVIQPRINLKGCFYF